MAHFLNNEPGRTRLADLVQRQMLPLLSVRRVEVVQYGCDAVPCAPFLRA